jgi:hypothetical protein
MHTHTHTRTCTHTRARAHTHTHTHTYTQGETTTELVLDVPINATTDLWWPTGHGHQPLHSLVVTIVTSDGPLKTVSTWQRKVGFRTVELIQEPVPSDPKGGLSMYFRVMTLASRLIIPPPPPPPHTHTHTHTHIYTNLTRPPDTNHHHHRACTRAHTTLFAQGIEHRSIPWFAACTSKTLFVTRKSTTRARLLNLSVDQVNNRPIFAKGANWINVDQFEPRVTAEKMRWLVSSAAAANYVRA